MKYLRKLLIAIPLMLLGLVVGLWLINEFTATPISLLARKQFDTSHKRNIYPKPTNFKKRTSNLWVDTDVRYTSKFENSLMDIYIPIGKENMKMPILFWVHGGGYVGGDKRDTRDYLKLLSADTGQIIVNINYALAPEYKHAIPVKQLNMAISKMKDKYTNQIDWNRISIGGDSVGAQIASEYILLLQNKKIRDMDRISPVINSNQVKKFISLSGLLEPTEFTSVDDSISKYLYERCGWAYFNDRNFSTNKTVKKLSISHNLKGWTQKVFLTDGNTKTFTTQMNYVTQELQSHNINVTKVSYSNKNSILGHEYQFDFSNKDARRTYNQLVMFFNN